MVTAGLVAGLGCRRGCTAKTLLALLQSALAEAGRSLDELVVLASSEHKAQEPGLQQLAHQLQVPLWLFSAAHLGRYQMQQTGQSARVLALTGSSGVAEPSALAAAAQLSGQPAYLLLGKRTQPQASVALASAVPR